MSLEGLNEEEILAPMSWPTENWSDHFVFVRTNLDAGVMGEAEGTLVAFLDVQHLVDLRAELSIELKGLGSGFSVTLHLVGSVVRRCVLSGDFLTESIDHRDRFDFVKPAKTESHQKKVEAQVAQDLGTGLEEGPDTWDPEQPPTLIGLIADSLEECLDPFPVVQGAEVAIEHAQDPKEAELAAKMHPFAALKALKNDKL